MQWDFKLCGLEVKDVERDRLGEAETLRKLNEVDSEVLGETFAEVVDLGRDRYVDQREEGDEL